MFKCYFSTVKKSSASIQAKTNSKNFIVSILSRLQCNIGCDKSIFLSRKMACTVNKIFAHAICKTPYEDTMLKPEDGKSLSNIFTECISGFNQISMWRPFSKDIFFK